MNTGFKSVACLAASFAIVSTASAAVVYDNSTGYIGVRTDEGNDVEVGDLVNFAGTERTLTSFKFEYFASGPVAAQVFLRSLNNEGFPGSVLYDSGVQALPSGFHTFNAEGMSLTVPDSLVWSVHFTGVDPGESAGLLFNGDAEIGSSADTFYRRIGSGWQVVDTTAGGDPIDNFSAQFTAVPEPGTWALLLGGLGVLGFLGSRRKA